MTANADLLELEAAVVRLEEKLIEAKAAEEGASTDLKAELREARRAFREARDAGRGPRRGARPGTVGTGASVES